MALGNLCTKFAADADLDLAENELIANALRLIVAGRLVDSKELMLRLLTPGPWQIDADSAIPYEVEQWLPMLCYWCDVACPPIGTSAARSKQDLAALALEEMERQTFFWEIIDGNSEKCVGQGWKLPLLDHLHDMGDAAARNAAFNAFCSEAIEVLKLRLQEAWAPAMTALAATIGTGTDAYSSEVSIAAEAHGISSQAIGHAIVAFLRKRGLAHNGTTLDIVHIAMALSAINGQYDDALQFVNALIANGSEDLLWSPLLHLPQVRGFFASGMCAASVGVSDESVAELMDAVDGRQIPSARRFATGVHYFCDSVQSFSATLAGSSLQGREIMELPILDTPERAYAVRTTPQAAESDWHEARELVAKTGRWPIVTPYRGGTGGKLHDRLQQEDFFSRFYFKEAKTDLDFRPRALLAAADEVDLRTFLDNKEKYYSQHWNYSEYVASALEATQYYCGQAPSEQELADAIANGESLNTRYQLDRWLLNWELRHDHAVNLDDVRQEWIQDDTVVLLFLPTPNSWDALAYINWFGTSDFGAENYIALGRSWQKRYGAELYSHSGTELKCFVDSPPTSIDDAWALAREHDLASDCTLSLPGIAVRHHAVGLADCGKWLLFQSP